MPSTDRISHDTGVSQSVQSDIAAIAQQLEQVMSVRNKQVNDAMADFTADNVSEQYRDVENRWHKACNEVNTIIALVKKTLAEDDDTATSANGRASSAVAQIG